MVRLLQRLLIPASQLADLPAAADPEPEALHVHLNGQAMPWAPGLNTAQGSPLPETCLQRGPRERPDFPHGRSQGCEPLCRQTDPAHGADVLFLPWCDFNHFGHLLTETAAWLWPLLDPSASPLNWPGWEKMTILLGHRPGREDPVPTLARVLKLPPERIRTTASLERPLPFARAIIPVPSMVNRRFIARHHLDAVRRLIDLVYCISPTDSGACRSQAAGHGSGAKVYLSRSRLSPDLRTIRGEQALEANLIRRGWQVVHPERLPMVEQLRTLARARVIGGELGSALHLLMYFGTGLAHKSVIGLGVHHSGRDPRTINITEQLRLQSVSFCLLHCLGFCRPRRIGADTSGSGVIHDRRLLVPASWLAERMDRLAHEAGARAARHGGIC